jgi:uncharacterized protein
MRLARLLGWHALALLAVLGILSGGAAAQDLQPVPPLSARVVDTTGTLAAAAQQGIEEQLAALERDKGAQVAFLIVATTQPEDIASYANRVGNTWKIGRLGVGDGVLLVVALQDRKVRIEVAKTLEGALPDLAAKQIIDEAITPAFRRGDFAGGLAAAAEQIGARVRGEALPEPTALDDSRPSSGFDIPDLAIFLFVAVPVLSGLLRRVFGQPFGSLLTGGGVGFLAYFLTASLVVAGLAALVGLFVALVSGAGFGSRLGRRGGWGVPVGGSWGGSSSGGWSSSSSGGFSSGGGGDFGGGGASGDW